MKKIIKKRNFWLGVSACFLLIVIAYFVVPEIDNLQYEAQSNYEVPPPKDIVSPPVTIPVPILSKEDSVVVTHLDTPVPLKAVYMSSWVAGTPSFRNKIVGVIKRTELNAVVIDVKDYTGRISFPVKDPKLIEVGSAQNRITDIKSFIAELHANNIYVIGRIATFQDPFLAKKWKDLAVKKLTDKNALWEDDKCKREIKRNKESQCTYWLDSGSQKVWDYVVALGQEAYADGFDEINYDYIRFPADGNMKDIYFPVSNGKAKVDVMTSFFKYLHDHFIGEQNEITPRPKLSADVFGMTMTNTDDLNIGQQLEHDAPYVDYLAPMVYPSHFPPGWNNFKKPATKPYEVIKVSMEKGVARMKAMSQDPKKLRPWLQDFNLGAIYTKELVDAQIKAVSDVGLDSWMLWDPANTYTEDALLPN